MKIDETIKYLGQIVEKLEFQTNLNLFNSPKKIDVLYQDISTLRETIIIIGLYKK